MMSDQKFSQDEEDTICRSMLQLSTAAHDYPTTTTSATPSRTISESPEKYAMAFSGKRQSPLSLEEPAPKRANSNSDHHHHLSGLTKLPLPQCFPLRRTVSEPIHSISTHPLNFQSQLPQNSASPVMNQESSGRNLGQESFPFPLIHRTVCDDPSPSSTATPLRPPRPRQSPSSVGESPTNKRVKRMKERMREMSQWWNQVLREQDEDDDDDDGQSVNHTCHPKEETECDMVNPAQEAVWVEKKGDCLVLHFRCPCGNGYQILLIGNTCYYKLTTF